MLHSFMSYTSTNSAYLQTMSINWGMCRTSLRHKNTILCAHKQPENSLTGFWHISASTGHSWAQFRSYNSSGIVSNKEFACIQSFGSSFCKLCISYMESVGIGARKHSWSGLLCWHRCSRSFPLQHSPCIASDPELRAVCCLYGQLISENQRRVANSF